MQKISVEQAIEQIVKKDPRYPVDAYIFVREALDFTIKELKKTSENPRLAGAGSGKAKERHVTGQQLLGGVRDYALQQFGPLVLTVLNHWNLRKGEDIGDVVYNMVSMSILNTCENDSREDFKNSYNFEETFQHPFEPSRKQSRRSSSPSTKPGWTKTS